MPKPIENIATLAEVELAYRANASVIGTAIAIIDTLLEIVEPDDESRVPSRTGGRTGVYP